MENKKILVLIIPYFGHVNPFLGIAHELVKRGANIIFYSTNEFKHKISETGSEYRELVDFKKLPDAPENSTKNRMLFLIDYGMDAFTKYLPELIKVVDEEAPDLIIYDVFALHSKYLMNFLKTRQTREASNVKLPKTLLFSQSYVFLENIYPSGKALEIYESQHDDNYSRLAESLKIKQKEINSKYSLTVENILEFGLIKKDNLVVVSIMPELHPCTKLYDERYKFVGCCVSPIRNQEITNPNLKSILDYFQPLNPLDSIHSQENISKENLKLVYVSLGSVFNKYTNVFEEIVDSIRTFDEENPVTKSNFMQDQLRVVVSLGKVSYDVFQNKIENEGYNLPNNILLLPWAPQIEILQRASLFVTHCGMNSTSEAVKYGVPMICVPIDGDQPYVALRVADELNLGINFDFRTLKSAEVRTAIHKILQDNSYLERMIEFSKLSRKYNGSVDAAQIIEKYLE